MLNFTVVSDIHVTYSDFDKRPRILIGGLKDISRGVANSDALVEMYKDEIVFRARSFTAGEWLPEYDTTIPLIKEAV